MPKLRKMSASDLNIETDKEGYLMNTAMWTREIAQALAAEELNSQLTEDHWKVVDCIRNYYKDYGVAPSQQMVCKQTGLNVHQIDDLFPTGYARGACRIAGIPKPDPHLYGRLTNYAGAPMPL